MLQTLPAGAGTSSDVRIFHNVVSDKSSRLSENYSLCTCGTAGVVDVSFVYVVLLNYRMK